MPDTRDSIFLQYHQQMKEKHKSWSGPWDSPSFVTCKNDCMILPAYVPRFIFDNAWIDLPLEVKLDHKITMRNAWRPLAWLCVYKVVNITHSLPLS